jgi:glycine cleavage system H lipoate-binding protein
MFNQLIKTIKISGNTYNRSLSLVSSVRNKTYINEYEWIYTNEWLYTNEALPKIHTENNQHFIAKVGITHKALEEFNELVYVEPLYNIGDIVDAGVELCVIESVKASDSLDAPFDCEVIEFNDMLDESLDSVNDNPECEKTSWFVKVKKID